MRRFFSSDIKGDQIFLDAEESLHLTKVLRLKAGDHIEVVDGAGGLYACELIDSSKRGSICQILKNHSVEQRAYGIHLAVAPTKSISRWEWFLEKATEIGIDRISPILTQNSERKVLKNERSMRILREAMKQSQQLFLPQLDELINFNDFILSNQSDEQFIAHCEDGEKKSITDLHQKGSKALILIGPEGDFDESEIQLAMKNGYRAISLGENRLRTETAAIVACHSIQLINA